MNNKNEKPTEELIERLTFLEYEIRRTITVREDQEEEADAWHCKEARLCGIAVESNPTKGELLNAVQTAVRAARSNLMY